MSALNREQLTALGAVLGAIRGTIAECGPMGAPGGVLYAALMGHGCTLSQFESIMGALVRSGRVRKVGECYHAH